MSTFTMLVRHTPYVKHKGVDKTIYLYAILKPMKKPTQVTTKRRIGIGLDDSDLKLIEKLKLQYGNIGVTAIIRMALRELARVQ
jgi:hypothetical protein